MKKFVLSILMCVALLVTIPETIADFISSMGLVAYWPMDESGVPDSVAFYKMNDNADNDIIINENGTNGNYCDSYYGYTSGYDKTSWFNGGIYFDSLEPSYIDTNMDFEILIESGEFTFSIWVSLDDGQPSSQQTFWGAHDSTNEVEHLHLDVLSSGKLQLCAASNSVFNQTITTDVIFQDGKTPLTHIVVTCTNNTDFKIYVNGFVVMDITTTNMSTYDSVVDFFFGALNYEGAGTYYPMDGIMDFVTIYDKALSAIQIDYLSDLRFDQDNAESLETRSSTLNDVVGGHDLTIDTPDTVDMLTTSGHIGRSMDFDEQYRASVADHPDLDFDANDDFLISFWYKLNKGAGTYSQVLIKYSGGKGYLIIFKNATGEVNCNTYDLSETPTIEKVIYTTDTMDNTWHHLVFVRDAGTSLKLYIDGDLKDTETVGSSRDLSNAAILRIGDDGSDTRYCDGRIDELCIYKGVVTADFVTKLYNAGNGIKVQTELWPVLTEYRNAIIKARLGHFGGAGDWEVFNISEYGTGEQFARTSFNGGMIICEDNGVAYVNITTRTQAQVDDAITGAGSDSPADDTTNWRVTPNPVNLNSYSAMSLAYVWDASQSSGNEVQLAKSYFPTDYNILTQAIPSTDGTFAFPTISSRTSVSNQAIRETVHEISEIIGSVGTEDGIRFDISNHSCVADIYYDIEGSTFPADDYSNYQSLEFGVFQTYADSHGDSAQTIMKHVSPKWWVWKLDCSAPFFQPEGWVNAINGVIEGEWKRVYCWEIDPDLVQDDTGSETSYTRTRYWTELCGNEPPGLEGKTGYGRYIEDGTGSASAGTTLDAVITSYNIKFGYEDAGWQDGNVEIDYNDDSSEQWEFLLGSFDWYLQPNYINLSAPSANTPWVGALFTQTFDPDCDKGIDDNSIAPYDSGTSYTVADGLGFFLSSIPVWRNFIIADISILSTDSGFTSTSGGVRFDMGDYPQTGPSGTTTFDNLFSAGYAEANTDMENEPIPYIGNTWPFRMSGSGVGTNSSSGNRSVLHWTTDDGISLASSVFTILDRKYINGVPSWENCPFPHTHYGYNYDYHMWDNWSFAGQCCYHFSWESRSFHNSQSLIVDPITNVVATRHIWIMQTYDNKQYWFLHHDDLGSISTSSGVNPATEDSDTYSFLDIIINQPAFVSPIWIDFSPSFPPTLCQSIISVNESDLDISTSFQGFESDDDISLEVRHQIDVAAPEIIIILDQFLNGDSTSPSIEDTPLTQTPVEDTASFDTVPIVESSDKLVVESTGLSLGFSFAVWEYLIDDSYNWDDPKTDMGINWTLH